MKFNIGDKVKVSEGSGTRSGKLATVVDRSKIKVDGRGVPTEISGAYKSVDWKSEVAIKYENGEFDTMYKNRLTKMDKPKYNKYAICTKSVGREDEAKYKRCKYDIGNPISLEDTRKIVEEINNNWNPEGYREGNKWFGKDIFNSEELYEKIHEHTGIERELFYKIYHSRKDGNGAEEIWENIELDEAIKKLPGREIESRYWENKKTISKIEKASKITPLYKIFTDDGLNIQDETITKKELIELWVTGQSIDFKLLPEEKSSYQKMVESPMMKKLQKELQQREEFEIGDTVTDGKGLVGKIASFVIGEDAVYVKPTSINGEKIDESKHSTHRLYNTKDLEKLSSLEEGIEVEHEHKDLYDRLKKKLESEGSSMPITEHEFYATIAKAHLKEDKDYYKLLKELENKKTPAEMIKKSLGWENKKIGNNLYLKLENNKFSNYFQKILSLVKEARQLDGGIFTMDREAEIHRTLNEDLKEKNKGKNKDVLLEGKVMIDDLIKYATLFTEPVKK